jgi:hypothetical protein
MDEEKKGVSRRKFLKGAAVGAAGVAAMGGLVGCASDGNDSGSKDSSGRGVMTAEEYEKTKWSFEIMPEEYPLPDNKIKTTITHDYIVIAELSIIIIIIRKASPTIWAEVYFLDVITPCLLFLLPYSSIVTDHRMVSTGNDHQGIIRIEQKHRLWEIDQYLAQ